MVRVPTHGPPTHPGEMLLEEFLEPLGLTQTELAEKLGVSYPRVNELIHGKRGVTRPRTPRFDSSDCSAWKRSFGSTSNWPGISIMSSTHRPRRRSQRSKNCPNARRCSGIRGVWWPV